MSNVYSEIDVLKIIAEKKNGGSIQNGCLTLPEYDLSVKVKIANTQGINGKYSAHVIFFVDHPLFDQTLVESCAGVGDTADDAIKMCAENFAATVLLSLESSLKCDGNEYIDAELDGDVHTFHIPCFTSTVGMGGKFLKKGDLWSLVSDVIPKYLGCKRVYWIKLFAAMTGKNITCEARVNGIVYGGLTELMKQRLDLSLDETPYGTYKAFIVLIQKEETFKPCPYTADQVAELTNSAIGLLKAVNDQDSHDKAIKKIIESAPVPSLGWEMAGLIPELYCMMVLKLNENDSLMYYCNRDGSGGTVRTSQLTAYDYIARGVYGYIMQNNPTEQEHLRILGSSGMFRAVNKALQDGAKMEDLKCSDIMYYVGEGYKIY